MYRCTLLHAECFFCSDFYENSGVRLLEEMWLLLGNTMSLLNSNSVGLKRIYMTYILEHCCGILENIIRIFKNPAAILEKSKPLLNIETIF